MTKTQTNIITALSLLVLVLGFLISRRVWFRVDLTADRVHTLQPASRNLYTELADQALITYYLSGSLAAAYPQMGEIEDLLREYAAHSRGRIRYRRRDPAKSGLVPAMGDLGIPALEMQTVEQDRRSVNTAYSGIVIEYLDRLAVIPLAISPETIEYDLSSRLRSLARGTDREAGIILGDSSRDWDTGYAPLAQTLAWAGFRVRLLGAGEEIPGELPLLLVFGGAGELDSWALYRIDRYIRGGGRVFFALETVFVDLWGEEGPEVRTIMDRGLAAMVSYYGVTVRPALTLDESALDLPPLEDAGPDGIPQVRIFRYPHWVRALPENANPAHPLGARFDGLDLFWPNPLDLNPPRGVEAAALFSSTPGAWLMTGDFAVGPGDIDLFDREAPDTRGTRVLGAALSGLFPSWFEGLPKPARAGSGEELPDMPAEAKPARIVVVGDADLASSLLEHHGDRGNLDFMIRAADWLTGNEDLIGLGGRRGRNARLDRIADPEKRAAVMAFSRVLNLGLVPLALVCAGFFLARKKREAPPDL